MSENMAIAAGCGGKAFRSGSLLQVNKRTPRRSPEFCRFWRGVREKRWIDEEDEKDEEEGGGLNLYNLPRRKDGK